MSLRKGSRVRIVGTRKTGKIVSIAGRDRIDSYRPRSKTSYITIRWDDGSGEQTCEGKLVERA